MKSVRDVTITVLAVFLILSLIGNKCSKDRISDLDTRLAERNLEKDSLKKGINERDNVILLIEVEKDTLRQAYIKLMRTKDSLERNEKWFKEEYWKMRDEVAEISADSSYNWLQLIAYPFGGSEKPYGFNGPQVKAIHLDKIDYVNKTSLLDNMELQLTNCESRNEINKAIADSTEAQLALEKESSTDRDKVILNMNEEIKLKDKVIKRERFWKRVGAVVILIETAALIIL